MAANNQLFQVDTIVVNGVALAFEHSTAELDGAGRYDNEVVPSASGDDFAKYKRVPTTLKCKVQFAANSTPDDFASISEAQISLRQEKTGKRCLLPKCSFGKMGAIGQGSVEVTFNVLSAPQWL